jgi:hypothetical protein
MSSEDRRQLINGILSILSKVGSRTMANNVEFRSALQTIKNYLTPQNISRISENDLEEYKRIVKSILGERVDLRQVEDDMNRYGLNPRSSNQPPYS